MKGKEVLSQYIPESAVEQVFEWIENYKIHLKITRSRSTKLGDYRAPITHSNHRITVNHDLNRYSFLITFVHELAHLRVFESYGRKALPHGKEWKREYKVLMETFIDNGTFPDDINTVLKNSIVNSKASSTSDLALSRVLNKYNRQSAETHLEDLEEDSVFRIKTGRQFVKGARIRTRYKCRDLQNKRDYLFHPLTPVVPVQR